MSARRGSALASAEFIAIQFRETGLTQKQFAEVIGFDRKHVSRCLRIDKCLTPVTKEIVRGKSWAVFDVLERLATLQQEEQELQATRIADVQPRTGHEAMAMLGQASPSRPVSRRSSVLERALGDSLNGKLGCEAFRVVADQYLHPEKVPSALRATHAAKAVDEAVTYVAGLPKLLRCQLEVVPDPELVRWLARQLPSVSEGQAAEIAVLAGNDKKLVKAVCDLAYYGKTGPGSKFQFRADSDVIEFMKSRLVSRDRESLLADGLRLEKRTTAVERAKGRVTRRGGRSNASHHVVALSDLKGRARWEAERLMHGESEVALDE